jgi:beta-glucanase (GH16 family)
MPKLPLTARFCLLVSLLTALLLSAGAGSAAAAASGKRHTHKTAKHHVTSARRHGKHTVKKVSTKKRHGHKTHEKKKGVKATAARSAPPAKKKKPTKPAKPTPTVTTPTLTTTAPTATTTATTTPTATTSAGNGPVGIPGNWNMVMDSEFTGSSLPSQWATGWFGNGVTGGVGGTSEADCYSPSDVTLPGDGTLHLNLTKTSSSCDGVTQPYTTGLITTDPSDGRSSGGGFTYTYGVAEAKIYVPANGTQLADWPSFWADGTGTWPETGEDDVLEGLGGEACFHFHDPLGGPGSCDTSITPGWHTFASDWQPGSVTYYYDGKDVGSISSGVTGAPMYLILGNGVSSTLSDTVADSMQVAYVRVWQS